MEKKKAYLVLANGEVYEGYSFGAKVETMGELIFTTSAVGYIETLTDPSFYGQMVCQTFPLFGDYGVNKEDLESNKIWLKAIVVQEYCQHPSNFRNMMDINSLLVQHNIPGIYGIDTRQLTMTIRKHGCINAKIVYNKPVIEDVVSEVQNYVIKDCIKHVSVKRPKTYIPKSKKVEAYVVLWDFGVKHNIIRELLKRNVKVTLVPYNTPAKEILKLKPNGIMLSNGPGDPESYTSVIKEMQSLIKLNKAKLPIMGICLGHQLFALAVGARTSKMKFGHHGANQPVKDVKTNKVYVSPQNHNFQVLANTLPKSGKLYMVNVNDNSCEGVEYHSLNTVTVQFHPEGCGGPQDTNFLFDNFVNKMKGVN